MEINSYGLDKSQTSLAESFAKLTVVPPSGLSPRRTAMLPPIVDPDVFPPVEGELLKEPLVQVSELAGVTDLRAYSLASLPGSVSESLVRSSVGEKLEKAARILNRDGYGLAVFDGWRSLELQQELYEHAYADPRLPPGFVTPPSDDPRTPPPHLTGGTVDVTLTWNGHALALGTDFDDFSALAAADALEGTLHPARDLRRILFWTMRSVDFVVIPCEWWHFEYGTRRWAAIKRKDPIYAGIQPQ